jgi:glycosyltransferase involved in cell wall biosynthesis
VGPLEILYEDAALLVINKPAGLLSVPLPRKAEEPAVTDYLEQHLRSRGIEHTGIWTRGIDTEVFNPKHRDQGYRDLFGVGPDDLLVTYVGRLAAEKDLTVLLNAWANLGDRRGKAQLVLVGQGPMVPLAPSKIEKSFIGGSQHG